MDIDLARTFLEIIRSGSFMAAAERLHITQTAVTARVQNLEGQLGCSLFVRNRGGARLTEHGERFVGHASQLVQTWEAARRELPLPVGTDDLLALGCETSLWNPLMANWLGRLRRQQPGMAITAEVNEPRVLHEKLQHGVLDAALVHQPEYWPGMQVEHLLEEKLIMVRTVAREGPYVYVDWGDDFRRQHDGALPHLARPGLILNLGPLALHYLLEYGGSGYFRTRVVQRPLEEGRLERVQDMPEFSYPVYLVYPRAKQGGLLTGALAVLRELAQQETFWI